MNLPSSHSQKRCRKTVKAEAKIGEMPWIFATGILTA
jgi:hypothetical protein